MGFENQKDMVHIYQLFPNS